LTGAVSVGGGCSPFLSQAEESAIPDTGEAYMSMFIPPEAHRRMDSVNGELYESYVVAVYNPGTSQASVKYPTHRFGWS
jgi:hypothetical protein